MNISRLTAPITGEELRQLTALMQEAVSLGASLGYTDATKQVEAMSRYWQRQSRALTQGDVQFFCARIDQKIVGIIGLEPCGKYNGSHRGEVFKLIVGQAWRRQGIAKKLMQTAVDSATQAGLKLLVLDTRTDDFTVTLYQSLGWVVAGEIPRYALSTSGEYQATTLMFLLLPRQ
ncbi:GNAT family N-acetyltransferase [Rosenbergiella nectarea]|uniref:GNAT family N-acetyltransferase n=1 Tax=Rosenbergiella nectarea TaxID=988801 RepID=UPI001BD9530E|nr:GNAT family N-acetyltransferase [Rosenbergiella nectarea]MBT0730719.1 GNAT family N-acetyltransferase [Rosenbergiella nectarea subsp. apis]